MQIARDICALGATIGLTWLTVWVWYFVMVIVVNVPSKER